MRVFDVETRPTQANRRTQGLALKDLEDKFNLLLAKLDTDTGVNGTDYASTLTPTVIDA